ncbi:MAG: sulfatase-like hydrolase/transferase [Planctomycetes bacterium]|nr:sulfatase-like hydrolase/transferase [Planctomycetota bacterium]
MRTLSRWLAPLLVLLACSRPEDGLTTRNAVLITLDTTRADALSCYGGRAGVTPHLDRLAAQGVLFTNARTSAPLTLPAHASMLTGLYPPRHTLRDNGLAPLPQSALTLAELARASGVQTFAVVASWVLDPAFGLDQGFDVYDAPQRNAGHAEPERRAPEVLRAALARLAKRDRSRPFFLWVHFYDPHVPYTPPRAFSEQAGGDAYLGEVASTDAALGELLAHLESDGTSDSTTLVVAADHGESLGEHGEPTHGALCYDSTVRVPLLVRWPDARDAGRREDSLVSVVDVFPTLLEALHVEGPTGVDGVSLSTARAGARGVYCESYSGWLNYGWSPLAAWVDERAKYLASSQPELFDPAHDPRELHDISAKPPLSVAPYDSALRAVLEGARLPPEHVEAFDPALLESLRALGYGATGKAPPSMPSPFETSDLPSPRERAVELAPLALASALADAGCPAEALPLLREILAANPHHWLALDYLGMDLVAIGEYADARAVFERRMQVGPRRTDAHLNLGGCLELSGDDAAALEHYEAALELDPRQPTALERRARLRRKLGLADSPAAQ